MKKIFLIGMIFVLIAGWVLGTGIMQVPPQTLKVVRYPEYLGSLLVLEKPMPFINDTDKTQIYFVWPRIPKTSIGAREESYSLKEPLEASAQIELTDVYNLTGNDADKNKVAYLTVHGTFEVVDWEKFLSELDPKAMKEEFRSMSRSEILVYNAGNFLFEVNVNKWFTEYAARTILVERLVRDYNLKTAEEIEYFLKVYRSWYWALGVLAFRQLEEEIVRNPFPDFFTQMIVGKIIYAASVDARIDNVNWRLGFCEEQRKAFRKDLDPAVAKTAESIVEDFKKYLKAREENWPIYYESEKQLSDFLVKNQIQGAVYLPQELYAARVLVGLEAEIDGLKENRGWLNEQAAEGYEFFKGLRLWESKGNDSLWRLVIQKAVQDVQEKSLLPSSRDGGFYSWLKTHGMAYLGEEFERSQELFEEQFGIKFTEMDFNIEEVIKAPVK